MALAAAGIAYAIAMRVLPWLGERADVTVPKEIEPVVVVLLLGLVTDYSIFFLSETRRRLRAGDERLPAARTAIAQVAPIVLTAGLIVAAGTAALVVGHLEFFRAFGPGLAATTLITLAVAVTLVPALVAIFGERLFGAPAARGGAAATGRRAGEPQWASEKLPLRLTRPLTAVRRTGELAREHQTPRWRLLLVARRVLAPGGDPHRARGHRVLVFAALNVRSTELGLSLVRALPAGSEVRKADEAASRGFAPGIVSPTEVDLMAPGVAGGARSWRAWRSSSAPARGRRRRRPPRAAAAARAAGRRGPRRRRRAPGRRPRQRPARRPGHRPPAHAARPDARLLRTAGLSGTRVAYGGQTALADDTVTRVLDDLARVAVVAVLVNLLLLALFMRALVAPLYLVASSILGLLATIGLTTSSSRASSARTTSPTTSRSPPRCCSSRSARTTTSSSPGASGRRRGACACARRSRSPRRRPRAR